MGNLGGGEILVILLAALIFLGPEKLPEVARQIGKVVGEVRKVTAGFQREVHEAMRMVEDAVSVAEREHPVTPTAPQVEAPVAPEITDLAAPPAVVDGGTASAEPPLPPATPGPQPELQPEPAQPPLGADVAHGGDR